MADVNGSPIEAVIVAEFYQVFVSGGEFLLSLLLLIQLVFQQYWALLLWLGFWLFLVRWPDLREQLTLGGWTAMALLYFLVCLTWGLMSAPHYSYFGVTLPSVLEKFFIGGFWLVVAFVCGWLQDIWNQAPEAIEIAGPPEGPATSNGHGHDH